MFRLSLSISLWVGISCGHSESQKNQNIPATAVLDASTTTDANHTIDASLPIDSGILVDASPSTDATIGADANLPTDARAVCTADSDSIIQIISTVTSGDTSLATNDLATGCDYGTSFSNSAPDIVHEITFPGRLHRLWISTFRSSALANPTFDTVIEMRDGPCTNSNALLCDDDNGEDNYNDEDQYTSLMMFENLEAGTYFIVDEGEGGSTGLYDLNVSGRVASGEACDISQINAGITECMSGESCIAGMCQ